MDARLAKFGIGQVVRHRLFPFRGVIFDVDPDFPDRWREAPYHATIRAAALRGMGENFANPSRGACGNGKNPDGGLGLRAFDGTVHEEWGIAKGKVVNIRASERALQGSGVAARGGNLL